MCSAAGCFARGASGNQAASHNLRRGAGPARACAGETRRVCEPGRGAARRGRVGTRGDGVGSWCGKTCPANTPGVGIGAGPWFWCVPRRDVWREVRVVIRPRHTPYEEARLQESPGDGTGAGLWFWCVPRRGVLRAVRVVIRPRHTTYEEAWHCAWQGRRARAGMESSLSCG